YSITPNYNKPSPNTNSHTTSNQRTNKPFHHHLKQHTTSTFYTKPTINTYLLYHTYSHTLLISSTKTHNPILLPTNTT
ncbi:hypothetical protein, partial [Bacillus pumilus]|uniref:hypothetical protein n=1 Tax=Bacillus pumilus TaxID=1408 RepID=UPI001C92E0CE